MSQIGIVERSAFSFNSHPGISSGPWAFKGLRLTYLMIKIWNRESIREAWKQGLIVQLPKKGNLKECKNSRGITLLSVVGNTGQDYYRSNKEGC